MKKDMDTDFLSMCKEVNEKRFNELEYIYYVPVYKEGLTSQSRHLRHGVKAILVLIGYMLLLQ
jgi:hypothetical protein